MKLIVKEDYHRKLGLKDMERAIKIIKDDFEKGLAEKLNLQRVSAPLFVSTKTGLNDNLSGVERSVKFDIASIPGQIGEVVQSLAKWKRMALYRYDFKDGEGIYTDMNAIRRDDEVDNIHSIYVDQWDWELVINSEKRTKEFLHEIIRKIVGAIHATQELIKSKYPIITNEITQEIFFITSSELQQLYPTLDEKGREQEITKKYKTVFIEQIGDDLPFVNKPHDSRSPDYDDWKLNGDLLIYDKVLDVALEITSMGIRVDKESLIYQLNKSNNNDRLKYPYHNMIINDQLPLTIGGGIGQSRLCMLMLECLHIGEVQTSIWPDEMTEKFAKVHSIFL